MKRNHTVLRYVLTIFIIALLAIGIMTYVNSRQPVSYESPITPVKVERAYKGSFSSVLKLNAYVDVKAKIPVVPFVAGTVLSYNYKVSDWVEKDSIMARIDSQAYELQSQQAQAAYLVAEATLSRLKNLYEANAVSLQSLEEAQAQRDAYKAQYDLSLVQLEYCNVKAPVSATVLLAPSAQGSVGSSSSPLYVLADMNNLVVKLNVPESYWSLVNGDENDLRAIVSHGDSSQEAAIESISPYIDSLSKTFEMTLVLENSSQFRPGMYVDVSLVYQELDDVWLMSQKVRKPDGSFYILDEASSKAKWCLENIEYQNDEVFVVPQAYERSAFISEGQNSVFDSQTVRVL